MIWSAIKHEINITIRIVMAVWSAIKSNPVTAILLLTVIMGLSYSHIEWPGGKFEHWNGKQGFSYPWHAWIVMHYLIGLIIYSLRLFRNISGLDKDVYFSYYFFDFVGFYSYMYGGWPEPKEWIIIGFCVMIMAFIIMRLWRFTRLL